MKLGLLEIGAVNIALIIHYKKLYLTDVTKTNL